VSEPVRVVVVDDHPLVREGIRRVLDATPTLNVVADAADGAGALDAARTHRPDVILLDITIPGPTGLEVTARLRTECPDTRVVIISVHDHPQYVIQAVRAGAHGYLLKDAQPAELRHAIQQVAAGHEYFSPSVAGHLSAALRAPATDPGTVTLDVLTPRERDVLLRIARGLTNKEIAADLDLSPRTVETHREHLMDKLDIHTVAGLTRLAIESGLLTA